MLFAPGGFRRLIVRPSLRYRSAKHPAPPKTTVSSGQDSAVRFLPIVSAIAFSAMIAAGAGNAAGDDATDILNRIDDLWRGESSHAIITMRIQTENYSREMRLEGWSKGKDKSLVRILEPLKEKGTATLKSGTNVYTYLPKTDRTIRLTSGMMMGSWMGSHFTNDDLVKESRLADDYVSSITFRGERAGRPIVELTLFPKPDAAVVWGKIRIVVGEDDLMPVESEYYDEDQAVVRVMTFSKIKKMGGRLVPSVMRLTPSDKPKEYTEMAYEDLSIGVNIDDSFFSLATLRRK
jgi:outer membrane lipoprotein-sorting protein